MKFEPTPSPGGKRSQANTEPRAEKQSEGSPSDLWDFDDSTPISQSSKSSFKESEKPSENLAGEASSVPIAPRGNHPRRDPSFRSSFKKNQSIPEVGESTGHEPSAQEIRFSKHISSPTFSNKTFDDIENNLTKGSETQDEPITHSESVVDTDNASSNDSPNDVKQASNDQTKQMTILEKLGITSFVILLIAGIGFFLFFSIHKLPNTHQTETAVALPIIGNSIKINAAQSYWRKPDASGKENVRRGTILLPVVELQASGGPGAIRIFFRDSDGNMIGDGATHSINGDKMITMVATAGFEDQGMFAAYRTGESKPWKIEILEGPSVSAPGNEFKKLTEIFISTQRR